MTRPELVRAVRIEREMAVSGAFLAGAALMGFLIFLGVWLRQAESDWLGLLTVSVLAGMGAGTFAFTNHWVRRQRRVDQQILDGEAQAQ